MKYLFPLACLICLSASAQTVHTSSGKVQRFENFPSEFVPARHVDVWLPEGYDENKKYTVLYLHDGQMLFDSSATWNRQEWGVDETLSALMAERKIRETIVVGIWNSGAERYSEYFPQKPFESLTPKEMKIVQKAIPRDRKARKGAFKANSDNYLKFLVTELKPFIDSHFSTLRNRQNTLIAGSSMGGLISIYALCEYPQVFGGAACLSTHWPGIWRLENNPIPDAFINYLEARLPDPDKYVHSIYFDCGTATLDSLYLPIQQRVDSLMKKREFSAYHEYDRQTQLFPGADHSEKAWRERFSIPASFLLRPLDNPTYDGMPIVWRNERYYGNIKRVEISREVMEDSTLSGLNTMKEIINFDEYWHVTSYIFIEDNTDTTEIIQPFFDSNGNLVMETSLNPDGSLDYFIHYEYNKLNELLKSIEHAGNGLPRKITEYEIRGDTTIAKERKADPETRNAIGEYRKITETVQNGDTSLSIQTLLGAFAIQGKYKEYGRRDKYGNWLEANYRIQYTKGQDGEPAETLIKLSRKIEYYH